LQAKGIEREFGPCPLWGLDSLFHDRRETDGDELVTNCDRFKTLKHSSVLPKAFTEQGVAMLLSVLGSDRAVEVNIAVMRAFVHLRRMVSSHADLARRLTEFEERMEDHDEQIVAIFEAIRQLMTPPRAKGCQLNLFKLFPRRHLGHQALTPFLEIPVHDCQG